MDICHWRKEVLLLCRRAVETKSDRLNLKLGDHNSSWDLISIHPVAETFQLRLADPVLPSVEPNWSTTENDGCCDSDGSRSAQPQIKAPVVVGPKGCLMSESEQLPSTSECKSLVRYFYQRLDLSRHRLVLLRLLKLRSNRTLKPC